MADAKETVRQHDSERVGSSGTLAIGARVGKYEILAVLGHGGFGITYRARDTQLGREVAIKEYLPTSFAVREHDGTVLPRSTQVAEDFRWGRQRFLDEAKTLALLEEAPGVVNVYDFLEANGTAYMVMALVRGETLEARLRRERTLPQPALEALLYPLLKGLERVHAAGFLHRDIKPANILIDRDGQPTLIDFGASRAALQGRTQTLTAVYTPGYAAFEQFTSAKQGPYTDIYALGATLYHCITGNQPPSAIERAKRDKIAPAAEAGKGRYPTRLLSGIDAALKVDEEDRPQTVAAWRRQLPGDDRPAPGWVPSPRRPWRLVIAGGGLLLCLGGGYYVWQTQREADRATQGAAARKTAEGRQEEAKERREEEQRRAAEEKARAERAARQKAETEAQARHKAEEDAAKLRADAERERQQAAARKAEEDARAKEAARFAEDEMWGKAKATNSMDSLRGYLEKYPSGRYVGEAQKLLEIAKQQTARRAADADAAERQAWWERVQAEAEAKLKAEQEVARRRADKKPGAQTDAKTRQDADAEARQAWWERVQAEAEAKLKAEQEAARRPTEEQARAKGQAQQQARDCAQCPEMVRIPSGAFAMGVTADELAREGFAGHYFRPEQPRHRVVIGYTFSLGRYEVTRGEFAAFVQATGRETGNWCFSGVGYRNDGKGWHDPGFTQTDRDPVVCVSWDDASAYVAWLSQTTGKKYRLPTEAEWEYAARAGTTTARYWGSRYQGACRYANVAESHGCQDGHAWTAPVGTYQPNEFGLYDMLGNVWEWTEDCWNGSYAGAPSDGSAWPRGDCSRRVLRGGSWDSVPGSTRSAYRHWSVSGDRWNVNGFRVARTD